MAVNKFSLNLSKSKFIIFNYRQKKLTQDKIPTLLINNVQIERKTDANFLELLVNEHLYWNKHLKLLNVNKTISQTIGVLNRLKDAVQAHSHFTYNVLL